MNEVQVAGSSVATVRKSERFCAKAAKLSCTAEEESVEQDWFRNQRHRICTLTRAPGGTIASRLLIELGVASPEEALRRVRRARPGAVETWDQD